MTDAPLIGPAKVPDLHVMSYNIRRPMPTFSRRSPDRWSRRSPLLRRLLEAEQPTLLGVQEATPAQVEFVGESLGRRYRWVGRGRDADGGGEACAIFYDADRLRVMDWTQHALSHTPAVAGSRSWGNFVPRSVVAAQFADLATGAALLVMNMHLDHLSRTSRLRSAAMLRGLAAAVEHPAVLMGDANTRTGSAPYLALTAGHAFRDSWKAASERLTEEFGTYSGYRAPRAGGRRIDWILVAPEIQVRSAAINTTRYDGAAPSDHEPVQALLRRAESTGFTEK